MFAFTKRNYANNRRLLVGNPDLICSYWKDGVFNCSDTIKTHSRIHGVAPIVSGTHQIIYTTAKDTNFVEMRNDHSLSPLIPHEMLIDNNIYPAAPAESYQRIPMTGRFYIAVEKLMYDVLEQMY